MRTSTTYALCALAICAGAACGGGERAPAPAVKAARASLVMIPGWVAGSGWPSDTVVALASVNLQQSSTVRGNVSVITAAAPPLLSTDAAVLAASAQLRGNVKANGLKLLTGGHVYGTASYNAVNNSNGTIDGAVTTPLTLPLAITVPTVPNFTAGTTNINLAASAKQTIAAGSYGTVTLQAGTAASPTVLTLSGGVYAFSQLDLNDRTRLECSAACEIRIKGQLHPGSNTYLGPTATSALLISAVQVFVEGTNANSSDPNSTPAAAAFGANSELKGFIFAPNGTLSFGSSSSSVGKFVARDVNLAASAGLQDGTGMVQLPDPWLTGATWPVEVVTALNSVDIQTSAKLVGDLGVIRAATAFLVSGFEVPLGVSSRVTGRVRGDTVRLSAGAVVTGSVSHNGLTNSGTIQGGTITPLTLPVPIVVPPFPSFTAGTTTVDVPSKADQTLAAGSYNLIKLRAGISTDKTVLTLTGGTYNIADLDIGDQSRLECSAPCELRVKNRIGPGGVSSFIGPATSATFDLSDMRIFVEGKNGGTGVPTATPFAAVFGATDTVRAYLFVPNGTLQLATSVVVHGRLVAKDVQFATSATAEAPPSITQQPASVTVTEGQSATFTCASSGTTPTFRWQKNGVDIASATSATFTIAATAYTDAATYRCKATTVAGTAISDPASLVVNLKPPTITTQPTNKTVTEGQSASFTCAASGTLVSFQWQKDGVNVAGATAATYSIASTAYTHAGAYRCVATNGLPPQTGGGSVTSNAATLVVNLIAPVITTNPSNLTVTAGQSASFTCAASGTLVSYQWQKNGANITGATAATYTIASTALTDAGSYRCIATNGLPPQTGGGSATSTAATLTVNANAPTITLNPTSVTVNEGQPASLTCAASGTSVTYQWQKDGSDVPGATSATYSIASTVYTQAGSYRCVASTPGGGSATSAAATLTVNLLAPVITTNPASATVNEGQPASFSCAASGTLVQYQWQKDGGDIAGATSQTYTIAATAYTEAGSYRCVARNGFAPQTGGGTATSAAATLVVNLLAPVITTDPANATVNEGQPASFSCAASGNLVQYQWQKDGTNISGATSQTYTIASTSYTHAGSYRCVATNGFPPQTGGGSATSTAATLVVNLLAPAITTNPSNATVSEGQSATFTCAASGTLVHFQWQKDGTDIAGATASTYSIAATAYTDAGTYRCIATNGIAPQTGGGSATSGNATLMVNLLAPAITTNPSNVTVSEGQPASFTCAASGTLPHYQWQKNGSDIAGATSSTYSIAATVYSDAGSYRCVVTNGLPPQTGGGTATSTAATLRVDLVAPAITASPSDVTINEGQAASFTCAASGTLVHFQWQKGGTDIPGATSATYSLAAADYTDAGDYRCVATNGIAPQTGGGSATSATATLIVDLRAPTITDNPSSLTVNEGDSASFTCAASGTLVHYQWQKGGTDIPGATSATFSIGATDYTDAGSYRCIASNGAPPQTGGGSVTSTAATLSVDLLAPVITTSPSDVTANEGQPATFTCAASGTLVHYQWQKGGVDIAGATSASFTIDSAQHTDAGSYRCVAHNGVAPQTGGGTVTSASATLSVILNAPTITLDPSDVTVNEGQPASFTCAASGTLVQLRWQKNGTDIPGATAATYTIAATAYTHAGSYRCVATNSGGGSATSAAATLTVNLIAPVITTQPTSVTVNEGAPASFTCAANGTLVHYQWQKNGVDIADATSATYTIDATAYTDAGSYRCVASNGLAPQTGGGTATSSAATLTVDLVAPVITNQPSDLTVSEGDTASFTCAASGTLVHYQWQKNGVDIPDATAGTFTIDRTAYTDAGNYRCVASNGAAPQTGGGSVTSNPAALTVDLIAPVITANPTSKTVNEGQSASFTCAASGTLVHYQWQKDGANIAGATAATYTIAAAAYTHAGSYRCVASNGIAPQTGGGSATSSAATLTVDLNAPVISEQPVDSTVSEGQAASFTCAATGTLVHYQWQRNGVDIAGATSATYSLAAASYTQAGSYRCVASNGAPPQTGGGSATSAAATLTVDLVAPVITNNPTNATVTEGESASFTCAASGTLVHYQWQRNGIDIAGATAATFTIAETAYTDVGGYRCIAANGAAPQTGGGSVASSVASLTVDLIAPVITTNPSNKTVSEGQSASFTCAASGTLVHFQWQKDGNDIAGATAATYAIAAAAYTHAGSYRCIASNGIAPQTGGGSATSSAATLIVNLLAPAISQQPADATVNEGQAASFTCAATGTLVRYQWQKNGTDIAGATSATLSIAATVEGDSGAYRCVASNGYAPQTGGGTATSNAAQLTVHLLPPVITQSPSSVTVDEGQPFSLSCAATGTQVTFSWEQDMLLVPGATSATYNVASALPLDAGSYRCFAANSGGRVGSNTATVTVRLRPPVITQQPQNVSVTPPASASFTCAASGTDVSYRWQKNQIDIAGATSATYTIAATAAADVGTYRCIATNSGGSATSADASLTLSNVAPAIVQQPSNTTVSEGQTFTVSVVASGNPLNYQWQRNGSDVPGATSASYSKQAVLSDDGAQYRVVVSNQLGTVTSNTVTITLRDDVGPTLTVNSAPTVTVTDDTIHITGTAVDNSAGSVQTTISNSRFPGQSFGAVNGSDGNFAGDVPLAPGENVLTVTVRDSHGNTSTYTITVTVKTTAVPRITITSPADGAVVTAERVNVIGYVRSSLSPDQIRLRLGNQILFPTGSNEQYAFQFSNVPLQLGVNTLQIDAETSYGVVSSQVVVTRVAVVPPGETAQPPVIELAVAQPRVVTAATSVTVAGTVRAQTCVQTITVNGSSARITGAGTTVSFDRTLSFAAGSNELAITVVATDCNQRTAQAGYTVVHDAAPPAISVNGSLVFGTSVNIVLESPYRLTGTVHDEQLAGLTVNDASVSATPTGISGEWAFSIDVPLQRNIDTPLTIDAWDLANQHTVRDVILRLETAVSLVILSPRDNSLVPVTGASNPLEITATTSGLLAGDTVTANIDGGSDIALAVAGGLANATVNLPGASATHEVRLYARSSGGALLASAVSSFTVENASDLPLQLVRQDPAPDSAAIEANVPIHLYFNRPVDPTHLELRVLETAHGKVYTTPPDGTDVTTQSALGTEQVDRELEPVPGSAQNLPGDEAVVFYPSRDYAYGGTVFVQLSLDGTQIWRSRFGIRPMPTLVNGFVSDQHTIPLEGIEVSLVEAGRSATTDGDGSWSFGFAETPDRMLAPGRYHAILNPGMKNPRYGSVEQYVTVAAGEINFEGITSIPIINTAEPFARVASRQTTPAVLASGDLVLDLSQADLTFPSGEREGDIHVQFMPAQEVGYRCMPVAVPDWGFAVQPIAVDVSGTVGISASLPTRQGSYDYLADVPARVLIVAVDPETLLISPVGVGHIDQAGHRLISEGRIALRRLDYIGISSAFAGLAPWKLNSYVDGKLTLPELISALESR